MSLQQWASNGWLRTHNSSGKEISNLLAIVERDLKDAKQEGISEDWQFGIAYNAALKLCTILLYAEGCVGGATVDDAHELIAFVGELRQKTLAWLSEKHGNLLPGKAKR